MTNGRQPPTMALCCVVDSHPRFYVEWVLWTLCATRVLSAGASRAVSYLPGPVPEDLVDWVRAQGVEIRTTEAPLPDSPHCNKIIPFLDDWAVAEFNPDYIVVTDLDLFFLSDPVIFLSGSRFRAAPNNHGMPPTRIWRSVLAATGMGRSFRPGLALFSSSELRETHINNISAGIVAAPAGRAQLLGRVWLHWAKWIVDNRSLLERWHIHVDQVAFGLAMEEFGEDVEHLPAQTNTVLQLLESIETPIALHLTTGHIPKFPSRFLNDRTLSTEGLRTEAVASIEVFNGLIREAWQVINRLDATREHVDKFLNPAWKR